MKSPFILYKENYIYLPERELVPYLLLKENYGSYFPYINLDHIKENFKELYHLYVAIRDLHSEYPDKDLDLNALQAYFFFKHPDVDKTIYLELFKTLAEKPLDPEVGLGLLKAIRKRKQALDLSDAAFKYASGYGEESQILSRFADFQEEDNETFDDIEVVSDDLEFLLNETVLKPGLRWRLNCLNRSLGSLRKSNFGFLFARPETGKTSFLASECSFMLTQLNENSGPIVWFNNEQAGSEVMLRVYQGFFGLTLQQLKANPKRWAKEFKEKSKGKFKLVDDANISKAKVEKVCKKLSPSLVIFDQIDKIKGFSADREDLRLGAIYVWARELAKTYCPVIGVCQADGSAGDQRWLTMENVSNAKTSKQAEADWILGIGKLNAPEFENVRFLNLSKNKLLGDDDSIPELRHGRFETLLRQETARYEDIVKYD